jgi:hypothetical protein
MTGRTNGYAGNGAAKHFNGSDNGHLGTDDPSGFYNNPFPDPEPNPSNPTNENEPFDLGEWDFGAAGIVASELPPRGW